MENLIWSGIIYWFELELELNLDLKLDWNWFGVGTWLHMDLNIHTSTMTPWKEESMVVGLEECTWRTCKPKLFVLSLLCSLHLTALGLDLCTWSLLTRQITGITSSPCKNKHHLQSNVSDWHPSPWLLSQLFLRWTLWKYGNLQKPADFSYSERSIRSCVDEPKCNSQVLAMVTQVKYLFFHIMQNEFHTRQIPHIMHEPWQSLQFSMNFSYLGVVLTLYYKCMHLVIYFNPGATQLFLHTFFFSLTFNILTKMPVASSSIDVWQQHITSSIVRFHFKNLFGDMFCHLHFTMNSASTEQSHPCSHLWFTGHCHDHILCLL